MKFTGYQRFYFTGQLFIPMVDPNQEALVMTYVKDIKFDFSSDPTSPRQVILADEPFPTTAQITGMRDRYGADIMPLAEWTITSVEPLINAVRGIELYRMQAALSKASDFGYEIARANA